MAIVIKISHSTFTVTIASPAVFTRVAHGLVAGDVVYLTTTGALPTGLAAGTAYYVISTGLAADTFRVSTTLGGSAVNTTGTQSGTHTLLVDRATSVEYRSLQLQRALTSQVDTCKFEIVRKGGVASGKYKPVLLSTISIEEGGTSIFGGQIIEIDEEVEGADVEIFTCQAKDYSFDMDRHLVVALYESMTVDDIIDDIVANFMPAGYTTTNVNCPITASSIAFNYEYPSKCLQQLAQLVNYDWYVDQNKNIYFFEKSTYPAPISLTDTSANYYFNTLKLQNDLKNLRNTVIVRGGKYLGSLANEQLKADGTALVYTQGSQYNTVYVKVNGVSKTVGIDNIDDPTGFDVLYNFAEKFVRFKTATKPANGDTLEVGGLPYIPIIVRVSDDVSVTAYGEFEFKIVDKSITSRAGARARARAELAAWAGVIEEGSFETMSTGLDVGQQISIQSTIRGIDTDYVISRITSTLVNGTQMLHRCTLVTTRTYGMIEFLMQLLTNKDKEIEIDANEVLETVKNDTETITMSDSAAKNTVTTPLKVISSTYHAANTGGGDSVAVDCTGANALLVIGNISGVGLQVKYNGVNMTQDLGSGDGVNVIFRTNNPPTGSNTLAFSTTSGNLILNVMIFVVKGINTADALEGTGTSGGTDLHQTISISEASNILSLGIFKCRISTSSSSAAQSFTPDDARDIEVYDANDGDNTVKWTWIYRIFTRAGSKTIGTTLSGSYGSVNISTCMALYNGANPAV